MRTALLILCLIGAPSPSPSNQKGANPTQSEPQANTQPSKRSSPIPTQEQPPANAPDQNGSNVAATPHVYAVRIVDGPPRSTGDTVALICTVLLTVAAIAGIIVAICTLDTLRRQTDATKTAADAAFLNAQAVIKSERPWMLFTEIAGMNLVPIEVQQNLPTTVGINFRNSGKTVARLTAWKFGLFITGINQVPHPSVFDTSGIPFKPTVIPIDVPLPHVAQLDGGRIIKQEELRDITERRISDLWLCGIIRYQDVFDPKNEHITKICRRYYTWDPEPIFVLDGPAEYNDET